MQAETNDDPGDATKNPGRAMVQDVLPVANWYLPTLQESQPVAFSVVLMVPAAQAVQLEAPALSL